MIRILRVPSAKFIGSQQSEARPKACNIVKILPQMRHVELSVILEIPDEHRDSLCRSDVMIAMRASRLIEHPGRSGRFLDRL
jgi:hypothetical protein